MVAELRGGNTTRKSAVMRRKRSVALRRLFKPLNRVFGNYLFSSLTRRILFLESRRVGRAALRHHVSQSISRRVD